MLDNKEKNVLLFLIDKIKTNKVSLVLKEEIVLSLSKKYSLSISYLDEIMLSLQKDGYLDYVSSESKKGPAFCITLKAKALTYKKDLAKQKKYLYLVLLRTVGLAVLSFVIGLILKAIF